MSIYRKISAVMVIITVVVVYGSVLLAEEVPEIVRFATFNASLYRNRSGELASHLQGGNDRQARGIAEIIQKVRPDVLLINEFDYDEAGQAAGSFCSEYLQVGQNGHSPILYPYSFIAPVNTGVSSGISLEIDDSGRASQNYGFGFFPGQYGMLLLSRFPIQRDAVRTFQKFPWKEMPNAMLPVKPDTGEPYFSDAALAAYRLSSKSHWDVPVQLGDQMVHVLAAHPTPPTFDGAEDRNGCRNHDEIRLWADYVDPDRGVYLQDDQGQRGGLSMGSRFVIMGDYNSDPFDGESRNGAINQLLGHPLIHASDIPSSQGGAASSRELGGRNLNHHGQPEHDTAMFTSSGGSGNLRVDYVLPSRNLVPLSSGIFWPTPGEISANVIDASDHRLVWIDLKLAQ